MSGATIAVLARAPIPGRCKTRLIPPLGPAGAARLHHDLVLRMVRTATDTGHAVVLFGEPDARHALFARCRRRYGVRLSRQAGGDLGGRMAGAIDGLLRNGAPAVLLTGTDCPALSHTDLLAADRAIASMDAVLQPSTDGGYVMLGAQRPLGDVLRGIDWSSGRELHQTLGALRRAGFSVSQLEPRADLDTPSDLRKARRSGLI